MLRFVWFINEGKWSIAQEAWAEISIKMTPNTSDANAYVLNGCDWKEELRRRIGSALQSLSKKILDRMPENVFYFYDYQAPPRPAAEWMSSLLFLSPIFVKRWTPLIETKTSCFGILHSNSRRRFPSVSTSMSLNPDTNRATVAHSSAQGGGIAPSYSGEGAHLNRTLPNRKYHNNSNTWLFLTGRLTEIIRTIKTIDTKSFRHNSTQFEHLSIFRVSIVFTFFVFYV